MAISPISVYPRRLFKLLSQWKTHLSFTKTFSLSCPHQSHMRTGHIMLQYTSTYFLKILNLRFSSVCKTCVLLEFTTNGTMVYRHVERGKMGSHPLDSHDNPGEQVMLSYCLHGRDPASHTRKQPPSESLP
jgi:hypothetical protein